MQTITFEASHVIFTAIRDWWRSDPGRMAALDLRSLNPAEDRDRYWHCRQSGLWPRAVVFAPEDRAKVAELLDMIGPA